MFHNNAEHEWSGAVHNGDVWDDPVAVVVLKAVNNLLEEGMTGSCTHDIVGNTSWARLSHPSLVLTQWVQLAFALLLGD
jgi:hypothetical protein